MNSFDNFDSCHLIFSNVERKPTSGKCQYMLHSKPENRFGRRELKKGGAKHISLYHRDCDSLKNCLADCWQTV